MSDYISQTITVSSCQSDISNQCRIKTPWNGGGGGGWTGRSKGMWGWVERIGVGARAVVWGGVWRALWRSAVQCSAVQCSAVQCSGIEWGRVDGKLSWE